MSILQYDTASGDPGAVLPTGGADAVYISGRFANYRTLKTQRPAATILPIAVHLPTVAELQGLRQIAFDFENGDLAPSQAKAAVAVAHQAGIPNPVCYGNLDTWEAARGLTQQLAGLTRGADYQGWLAHPDAIAIVPAGFAAKQYLFGVDFDTSIVENPATFYNLANPQPAPETPEDTMAITSTQNKDGRLEVFVETGAGEILHIAQDEAGGDWWRDEKGQPKWLSLGTPGK